MCVCTCTHVYIHINMCTCIYVCIHTYMFRLCKSSQFWFCILTIISKPDQTNADIKTSRHQGIKTDSDPGPAPQHRLTAHVAEEFGGGEVPLANPLLDHRPLGGSGGGWEWTAATHRIRKRKVGKVEKWRKTREDKSEVFSPPPPGSRNTLAPPPGGPVPLGHFWGHFWGPNSKED